MAKDIKDNARAGIDQNQPLQFRKSRFDRPFDADRHHQDEPVPTDDHSHPPTVADFDRAFGGRSQG